MEPVDTDPMKFLIAVFRRVNTIDLKEDRTLVQHVQP
jgi:hypothetical protein